ncbi:hypothetical protein FRC11_010865 [Ceratobasidium sp. 423]|nr:hypothetical protein FRC11_010865 [Ceratobasidium sp. 423]
MPLWNTQEETDWLIVNYLPVFWAFEQTGAIEVEGKTKRPMVAFKQEIVEAFGKAFPYRHPLTDMSSYPEEQQCLQFDQADWATLGEGIVDESEVQAAAERQQSDDPPHSVKSGGKDEWLDESIGSPVTRAGVRTRAKEREKVRPWTPKRPQPKVGNTGKRMGKKKESGSKISQATHTQPMEHVQSSEPIDPTEPLDHGEPGSGDALGPTTAVSTSGSKEGDKTTLMKTTPGPKVVGQPAKRLYPAPKDYAITPSDSA